MADKSFGVKELNLLNASGTPTITSPNNLNLNANTVAISTSVTIGHNLTVSANAGIASLNVTGVSTFVGLTTFKSDIHIVGNQAIDINNNALLLRGNNGGNGFITNSIGHLYISSLNDVENMCTNNFSVKTNTSEQAILATKNGSVAIYHDGGNKKLETTSGGIDVTGTISADNQIVLNSGDSTPARIDLYCEVSNAHYTRLQAPAHSTFSGNVTATLPNVSGNLAVLLNAADNRVVTATGTHAMNAESGFTFDGTDVQIPDKILLNTAGTYVKSNQLYYKPSGTAYIDHGTTGQDIQIRMSTSSILDTTGPTFKSNGNLAFAAGKGIDFSAAGNTAGMTGELLNDYEEGTWTPEIKGTTGAGTASYNNQVGKYLKIGNWVYLTWVMGWSSGSAGGEMRTTGFPFTPATDCTGIGSVMFNNVSIHSNVANIATYIGPGNDYCYFYTSRSSSSWITVNYSSSGNLIANVSFRTA